ncbi:Uncharacterised protein [Enterococcus faecium]|nr:Uncharacterised protein [Enterococcus faecium]
MAQQSSNELQKKRMKVEKEYKNWKISLNKHKKQ